MDFAEFERRVQGAGLVARDCGNGHWRVEGGKYEVNWWPLSRRKTIYVNGLSKERTARQGDLEAVLRYATEDPKFNPRKRAKRKKSYTRIKKRRLKQDPHCYWCRCGLNMNSATIDHKIALSRGGSNADDNLVLSCEPCNKEKGHEVWTKEGSRNDDRNKEGLDLAVGRDLGSSEEGMGRSGSQAPTA